MIKYDKKVLEKTLEFLNFFQSLTRWCSIRDINWLLSTKKFVQKQLSNQEGKSFRLKIVSFAIIS